MKLETARGVRDIDPKEQLQREEILSVIQKNFRLFGFQPLDTPIIERYDVLSAKFAAGEESDAMKETYRLTDQGGRELALRFDLTVPLARYVGMNPRIPLPFARSQVGKVYRDAPVRKGRYREFTQCDADIIGSDSMLADATVIKLALAVFEELGLDVTIRLNNRKFLNALLYSYGIDERKAPSVMTTIDKLEKLGRDGVLKELEEKNVAEREALLDDLSTGGNNAEKLVYFLNKQCDAQGLEELKEVLSYVDDDRVVFDPTIARGLGYYTGTVFEVFSEELDSSIGAGGRYDDLINGYLDAAGTGRNRDYPGVGFSFGLDRMVDVLKAVKGETEVSSSTRLLIVPLDTGEDCMRYADELRAAGVPTAIDYSGRKLGKVFAQAAEMGIPFVAVVGEDELKNGVLTVKELASGEQKSVSLQETIELVR